MRKRYVELPKRSGPNLAMSEEEIEINAHQGPGTQS